MPLENLEILQPGDLCVITTHPHLKPAQNRYVGCTVVLIGIETKFDDYPLAPYWRCSGLSLLAASHQVLKRIPPERLIDARGHLEPVNEINDEGVTCP